MSDFSAELRAMQLQLRQLERSGRRWRMLAVCTTLMSGAAILAGASIAARTATAAVSGSRFEVIDSLKVRALIVVDSSGRERARVAAPLPDPLMLGRRVPRGGAVSGFLISDAEGNERGGYVTSDRYPNAFLTLDDMGAQDVLFLAEPQGSATLMIRHEGSLASIGAHGAGPFLRLEKDRVMLFHQPVDSVRP